MSVRKGLEGVVVDSTAVSKVISEKSSLIYRGYPVDQLTKKWSYEAIAHLLIYGSLPEPKELENFKQTISEKRSLKDFSFIIDVLKNIPDAHPMDMLRTAVSLMGCGSAGTWDKDTQDIREKGLRILALAPVFIAAHSRLKKGESFIEPDPKLSTAENFFYMCFGEKPDPVIAKNFDRSLILYAEHGFNASTFTARVIASTTSDIYSAVAGAIGSLKGPLHGGANEQVMYMMKEIGSKDKVSSYLSQALLEKKKIMGFGHRVYKKGDSRVPVMYECLQEMARLKGDNRWLEMYNDIRDFMKEKKNILPNVDFPAGPAYYMMGLDIDLYTPIFVMSRIAGWTAHIIEQKENNRIIRPMSEYIGPSERTP